MDTTYKGETNKTTTVKLPSSIQRVMWSRLLAAPRAVVGLEVFTQFVGNGSEMEIKLTDQEGKNHGTFKDKLIANRFTSQVTVPPSASGALFAEVKLPRHGLAASSPALLLMPPVEITNAKWSAPEVRRGEVLTLSADVRGAPDGTEAEVSIWEHDSDGAHDAVTKFPVLVRNNKVEADWEFEYVEDTDDIPTDEELERGYQNPEYFFRVSVRGVTEESGLIIFRDWLELEFVDFLGQPYPGEEYIVHLPDGTKKSGKLDKDGFAREDNIPPGRSEIELPGLE